MGDFRLPYVTGENTRKMGAKIAATLVSCFPILGPSLFMSIFTVLPLRILFAPPNFRTRKKIQMEQENSLSSSSFSFFLLSKRIKYLCDVASPPSFSHGDRCPIAPPPFSAISASHHSPEREENKLSSFFFPFLPPANRSFPLWV